MRSHFCCAKALLAGRTLHDIRTAHTELALIIVRLEWLACFQMY
jgi:hypothetical protein